MPDDPGEQIESVDGGEITAMLRAAESGDRDALDRLFQSVYGELRRIAHREIASAGLYGTLNTTGRVHEAYLKMSRGTPWTARDRMHFYSTAARAMRLVLLDDARRRLREKRGGGRAPVSLQTIEAAGPSLRSPEELIALDAALTELDAAAPELAQIVDWRFFAGLSVEEIASVREVSDRTVRRQWRAARAFLYGRLSGAEAEG